MCRPKYFDVVHYKLNSHMLMEKNVNRNLALHQWMSLRDNIERCDVKVDFIKPKKDLVDMVFAANGALIYENKAIVSKFNAEPRKPESFEYFKFFDNKNYETHIASVDFEGAGDGLFSHNKKHLWLGHGFRTIKDSHLEVKSILDDDKLNIHSLELVNDLWYHLDTCFCPIGNNDVLLYDKAFTKESLHKIYDVYGEHNCIHVSDEDASNFACNSISLKNHENSIATIIGNKFTNDLRYKFFDLNYSVVENDMSEFLLSGGSTKCCILDIEKDLDYYEDTFGNKIFTNNQYKNNIYYKEDKDYIVGNDMVIYG